MRKLIYSMMVSLDGFVETAAGKIHDSLVPDAELHRFCNQQARDMGGFLYGRRMHEMMEWWRTSSTEPPTPPHAIEFARIWRQKPKYVFSRTLEPVPHDDVTLVRDHVDEHVARLKEQPGDDLGVGGPQLAAGLMRAGLVDEVRLIAMPVVLGGGKPFFPPLDRPLPARLVETRTFGSGAVYLRYELGRASSQASSQASS
jgi:dihydrofolate reductase